MSRMNSQGELGGMSPPLKGRLDLEINTLQNAPREADKLGRLLQSKQRQKDEAMQWKTLKGWLQQRLKW